MAARAPRQDAATRQAGIRAAATRLFAERGWGSTTTAQIASAAEANEALVFRHFGSKRTLYLACIDGAWADVQQLASRLIDAEPDVARHWRMPGRAFLELSRADASAARLWARALAESTGDPDIDVHLDARMCEVHAWVAQLMETSQAAGGILPDRDPQAEAWTIVAYGWLGIIALRLGDDVPGQFDTVLASHREWLTGHRD